MIKTCKKHQPEAKSWTAPPLSRTPKLSKACATDLQFLALAARCCECIVNCDALCMKLISLSFCKSSWSAQQLWKAMAAQQLSCSVHVWFCETWDIKMDRSPSLWVLGNCFSRAWNENDHYYPQAVFMRTLQTPKSLQTKKSCYLTCCESSMHSVLSRQFRSKLEVFSIIPAQERNKILAAAGQNNRRNWISAGLAKVPMAPWSPFRCSASHRPVISPTGQRFKQYGSPGFKQFAQKIYVREKYWQRQESCCRKKTVGESQKQQKTTAIDPQFARLGSSQLGIHGLQFLIDTVHGLHLLEVSLGKIIHRSMQPRDDWGWIPQTTISLGF